MAGYKGPLYAANGVFLWLLFLAFRVINLPLWMYQFYKDSTSDPNYWNESNAVLKYACFPSTLFLWLLSCLWFHKITVGMLKATGITGSTKKKQ